MQADLEVTLRDPDNEDAGRIPWALERIQTLGINRNCLLYTSPSPRDATLSRMPSSA